MTFPKANFSDFFKKINVDFLSTNDAPWHSQESTFRILSGFFVHKWRSIIFPICGFFVHNSQIGVKDISAGQKSWLRISSISRQTIFSQIMKTAVKKALNDDSFFHFYCIRDWQISSEKSSDSCLQKVKTYLRNCVAWLKIETRNLKWSRCIG